MEKFDNDITGINDIEVQLFATKELVTSRLQQLDDGSNYQDYSICRNRDSHDKCNLNDLFDKLEVVGTDEKIKPLIEFLTGDPFDGNKIKNNFFGNIIKVPEELDIEVESIGLLTKFLLFGEEDGEGITSRKEANKRFKAYDLNEKQRGFELALRYHSNIKKYGHISKYSWLETKWRTALSSIDSFLAYKDSPINVAEEEKIIPGLFMELSEKFPELKFNCIWNEHYDQYMITFLNGKLDRISEHSTYCEPESEHFFGNIQSYFFDPNDRKYRTIYQNTLKIVGSNEQITEVSDFIKGDPFGDGLDTLLDLNKIIKIPDELPNCYDIDVKGRLVHSLLFGNFKQPPGHNSNSVNYMQRQFKRMSINEKNEAFQLALEHQSMIKKYGCFGIYGWSYINWGVQEHPYNEIQLSQGVITFITERSSCKRAIIALSKKFPLLTFIYIYSEKEDLYPINFQTCFTINNGVCQKNESNSNESINNTDV